MRALAFAALLMHACWPFVGQLRAATPAMVQVVCSVHGTMWIPVDDQAPEATARPAGCALCSAVGTALASFHPESIAEETIADAEPAREEASPPSQRSLHSPSRPRAPPYAS